MIGILLNPRVLVTVGLLVAACAAYLWIDHRGFERGVDTTTASWQKREAEELARVNVELERLNRQARSVEHQWAMDLEGIASDYEKELRNARRTRDAALASSRRLRDPGAAPCEAAGAGAAGAASTTAGSSDGAAGGFLSDQAAVFLLGLAAEADEVVLQLQACQRVVMADRSTGGAPAALPSP